MIDFIQQYHATEREWTITFAVAFAVTAIVSIANLGVAFRRRGSHLARRVSLILLVVAITDLVLGACYFPERHHDLTRIGEQAAVGAPTGAVLPDHAELGTCVVEADIAAVATPTTCTARLMDGDSVATWALVVGNDRTQWVRIV